MPDIIIVIVGTGLLLEAVCAGLVVWLRQECVWLITKSDLNPKIDAEGLNAFMEHGWDSELGWVRKPNTRHGEQGKDNVRTSYSLNAVGARKNPHFENRPPEIVAHGDSYTFARQVNDAEAWPHVLSELLDVNVANYGVGNYGLDQALLRLERESASQAPKVMIIGVVPETMCRILSVWKHFSEYGNIFGFKPRFHVKDGKLELQRNPVDSFEKFFQISSLIPEIKSTDYFFENKFKSDMLTFPYAVSIARTWRRSLRLMAAAFSDRIGLTTDRAFIQIMERNIDLTSSLYRAPEATALFDAICDRFVAYAQSKGATPILIMIPQMLDLEHIRAGDHYYRPVLEEISNKLTVLDLAPAILSHANPDDLYIHDRYGGHMSALGNKIIAEAISTACREALERGRAGHPSRDNPEVPSLYPFASGDLLARPNTYFYTPFDGWAFIDAWRTQRGPGKGTDLAQKPPPDKTPLLRAPDGSIKTERLLEHLFAALHTDEIISNDNKQWLEKLLKKFETTKRIHVAYDNKFRAIDKSQHFNHDLYIRLAEVFERAYTRTGDLPYLNGLLKCVDTLLSFRIHGDAEKEQRLSALVLRERAHIDRLLPSRSSLGGEHEDCAVE